jgi:peptidylprolyl isomerase
MRRFLLLYFVAVLANFLLPTANSLAQGSEKLVLIETSLGNIKLKLYDETPLHRDNFVKLIEKHFYDSLLFHRVINTFMIQGGDPDSKKAPSGKLLGDGDVAYTIPAEFNPKLYHKRGVLAAARNSDEANPEQASSGCQFYIVQGKAFNDSLLDEKARRITRMKAYNKVVRNKDNKTLIEKYNLFLKQENADSIKTTKANIDKLTEAEVQNTKTHEFTNEQKKMYNTIGGTPHLDGSYTVFGEVLEGMEVVDKIAAAPRDKADRPLTDIRMKISLISK